MTSNRILTAKLLSEFRDQLLHEEKSKITVEKYVRDVRSLMQYVGKEPLSKDLLIRYKAYLVSRYAVRSVNSMLASVNALLRFMNLGDCRVRSIRTQRQVYCTVEREMTRGDYLRLLDASKSRPQLNMLIRTIGSTGIRISELNYFTVEAVRRGEVSVHCKAKTRRILLPKRLQDRLLAYARKHGITSGAIFITRGGKPLDRSNVWRQMKNLCAAAGVQPGKVFPHNLRKLFARSFYAMDRDIAKLADVLGLECAIVK